MKRLRYMAIAASMLLAAACHKDNITVVDDTTPSGGGVDIDDVDNIDTNYDRTVNVVFAAQGASVSGTGDSISATVSGNDVTLRNLGTEKVCYNVSGSTDDGFLKIYSGRRQAIVLNGVAIRNRRGAAINVQGSEATPGKGKRVDLVLKGSSTLADGSTYTLTPATEDEKGAVFSEGQIVVSGTGTLGVTATGKAGLSSDDYVALLDGCNVCITTEGGHGVRGKECILVGGGTIDVTVTADGKKGFSSDSLVRFDGGETTIHVSGNTVVDNGDTSGTAGVKADRLFEMNAGTLTITNSGSGGKGISCDGPCRFNGGTVDITVTGGNFGSTSGGGHGPGGWGGSTDRSVGAKGIKCDGDLSFDGSIVTVSASNHEGIESKGTVTITGGQVYTTSSDDAINAASTMTISGGYLCAHSTGNDGIDANGNIYIDGGVVYAIGKNSPEMAIDANSEGGYKLYVRGGTVIALGALESGAQLTQTCYQASSWNKNTWYSITVGDDTYAFKTPASGGTKLVVSGAQQPSVRSGVSVSGGITVLGGMMIVGGTVEGGTAVNLSNYSSGGGWW